MEDDASNESPPLEDDILDQDESLFEYEIETSESGPSPVQGGAVLATQWLGEPCEVDGECLPLDDGTSPTCFRPSGSARHVGFCTVSCEGFCPDFPNKPETFCGDASHFQVPASGLCVAKAHVRNASCAAWPEFSAWESQRYVGSSYAQARTAVVCLATGPYQYSEEPIDSQEAEAICGSSSLAVSNHADDCTGVTAETWRCACSPRFETVISQVCRGGIWVNYDLDPVDCGQCDGDYSAGCEPRQR